MKYSTRLSDALHVLGFVALYGAEGVTSAKIAESVKTHPSFVRQLLSKLKAAGIVHGEQGRAAARLARPTDAISMLDVYRAVEGDKPLLHLDIHTNPECGVGANMQYAIGEFYEDVQNAAYAAMQQISLADIIRKYEELAAACQVRKLDES